MSAPASGDGVSQLRAYVPVRSDSPALVTLQRHDLRAALAGQLVGVRVGHVLALLDGERVARGERPLVPGRDVRVERQDHRVADLGVDGRPGCRGRRDPDGRSASSPRPARRCRSRRAAPLPARPAPAPPRSSRSLCALLLSMSSSVSAPARIPVPLPVSETRDVCQAFAAPLSSQQGNHHPFVDLPRLPAYGHCTLPLRCDRRRRRPRRDLRRTRTRAPQRRQGPRRRARPGHLPPRLPGAQERRVLRLRALRHHLRLGRRRGLQRRQAHADAGRGRLAGPLRRQGAPRPSSSATSTASGASTAPPRRSTAAARSSRSSARRRSSTA